MKGKRIGISVCVVLMLIASSMVSATNVFEDELTQNKAERQIKMNFNFIEPKLNQVMLGEKAYASVAMDLPTVGNVGEPEIPVKPVNVLLPYGKEIKEIKVNAEKRILVGKARIAPKTEIVPIGENDFIYMVEENEEIYESSEEYPGDLYEIITTQYFRGFPIVTINLYPVQWNPSTEELYLYPNMELVVELKDGVVNELFRGTEKDREIVTTMVDNPREVLTYPLNPSHSCEYVIITTEALKNAPGPYNFQALVNSKIAKGMNATIVTVEWIYSNFAGVDNPEKIRNFIRWAYQEWHTQYVLLGGDADDGNEIIPVRRLWNETFWGNYKAHIPSDLYYACLDGTFNYDNDDKWGEPNDGEGGKDIDLLAEVYVGRAPVDNVVELANFVRKTLDYDTCQASYLHNALLCSEYVGFGGAMNYGSVYKEEMRNCSNANGYYTVGIPEEEYNIISLHDAPGYSWNKEDLKEILNSGVNIINHLGHGTLVSLLRMQASDIETLENDGKYFFLYTQACLSGNFTYNDCIAENFVTSEKGPFAIIANSDYGFGARFSTDAPSQAYDRAFWHAVFGENIKEIGKANHRSKEFNLYRINEAGFRWCYYTLNLLGDPEISIKAGIMYENDVCVKSINDPDEKIATGNYAVNATIENLGINDQAKVDVNCSIYKLTKNIHFFDDMESGTGNWTIIDADGDGYTWTISSARYYSPTHSFRCTNYTTYLPNSNDIIISKPINLNNLNNAILEFRYWAKADWLIYPDTPYADYLSVYLSNNEGVTWVEVKSQMVYTFESWYFVRIPIEKYVELNEHVRIKFTFVSDALSNYEGVYIDDVIVYSWDAQLLHYEEKTINISSGEWKFVEFTPYNFSSEGFYAINVTAKLPSDEYLKNNWRNITVEVINIKDAGVISINYPVTGIATGNYKVNATVINYGTLSLTDVPVNCTIYYINQTKVLEEDFEFLTPPNFRPGWLVVDANGDNTKWATLASNPYDGFNSAYYQSHSSNTANDWVFTSALNLKGGATYTFSFWYRVYSASYPASLQVMIGTSQAPDMTTTLWSNNSLTNTAYQQATVIFSVSTTGTYYIGFYTNQGSNTNRRIYIDQILLREVAYEIVFESEITLPNLPVKKSAYVEFPFYNFNKEGLYLVNVMTKLPDDGDTSNDWKNKTIDVICFEDAGIKQMNYPMQLITTGSHKVNLTIKNYGNVPLTNVGVNCLVYSVGTTLVKQGFDSRSSSTAEPGWTFSGVTRISTPLTPSMPSYLSFSKGSQARYIVSPSISFGSGNYAMEIWAIKTEGVSERVEFFNISYGNSTTGPWNILLSINSTILNYLEIGKWYRIIVDLTPCAGGNRYINISASLSKTSIGIDDLWIYNTNLISFSNTLINLDFGEEKYVEFGPFGFADGYYDIISQIVPADEQIGNNFLFSKIRAHNLTDGGILSINYPPPIIPTGSHIANITVKNFGNIPLIGNHPVTDVRVNCSIYLPIETIINETFEGLTPPNFRAGWNYFDGGDPGTGSGNSVSRRWASYNNSAYAYSPPTQAYFYFGTTPNNTSNDWLFTNATSLEAGKAYKLSFWYRTAQPYHLHKLAVWIGDAQNPANMTTKIWDNSFINNTVHQQGSVIFTVPTDGTYYIGFYLYSYHHYAGAIYLDNIELISLMLLDGEEKTLDYLAPGEEKYVTFGSFNAPIEGEFIINFRIKVEGVDDENISNDAKHMTVKVWNIDDAGTKSINYPPAGLLILPPDESIKVNATIANFGNVQLDTFNVNCSISKLTYSPLLEEDFENGIPSDWTIENGGTTAYYPGTNIPATWTDQNPGHRVPAGGCRGKFAIVDNDYAGHIVMEEGLVTKTISCLGTSKVILEFDHYWGGGLLTEIGQVQVMVYNQMENEWETYIIDTFRALKEDMGHKVYDISSYAANKGQVKIRWYYNSYQDYGYWWMIDNVRVGGEPTYNFVFGDEKAVNGLNIGEENYVEFNPWDWFNSGAGWYAINVTTLLSNDDFPANDKKTTIIFLQGAYDVEVKFINSPLPGTYPKYTLFIPNATVKNIGFENITNIVVNCTIRNSANEIVFTDEQIISSLVSGQQTFVEFNSWNAIEEDTYRLNISAYIYGDADTSNNYKEISLIINDIPDVGVVSINYPTGTQFTGSYAVNATVRNFGNVPVGAFIVNCTIRNSADAIVFTNEKSISGLAVGQQTYVVFDPWTVSIEDTYKINVTTKLTMDENNSNDYKEITVIINDIDDVGVTSINYPPAIMPVGVHVVNATIKNFGNIPKENIPVNCSIYLLDGVTNILTEGFESNLEPPAGWNEVDVVYTGGDWSSVASGTKPDCTPHSGYYMARFNSGTAVAPGSATRLYPDQIDFTGYSTIILSFWMYHDTNSTKKDRIVIQYSLDNISWSNITTIYRYDGSTGWKLHTINLSPYVAGNNAWIAFTGIVEQGGNIYIDDVSIITGTLIPYLSEEKTISYLNAGETTYLTFTPIDASVEGIFFLISVKTKLSGDENIANDEFLMLGKVWNFDDVGVVAINYPSHLTGPGWHAVNATIANFGNVPETNIPVNCSITQLWGEIKLNEGFEKGFGDWNRVVVSGSYSWQITSVPHSGSYSAYSTYISGERYLASPVISLGSENYYLEFWLRRYYSAVSGEFFNISVGPTQNGPWTNVLSLNYTDLNSFSGWTKFVVNLSAYSGESISIKFNHKAINGAGLYLDDIYVYAIGAGVVFENEKTISSLQVGEQKSVVFDNYNFEEGRYIIRVKTMLEEDEHTANDIKEIDVLVITIKDAGVISIDYPLPGNCEPGNYSVKATVRNYGTVTETFDVKCSIYREKSLVAFSEDVEKGWDGWGIFYPYGVNLWHISSRKYVSANHSFYCGDELTGSYYPDMYNWLLSPGINVAGATQVTLSLKAWIDVEEGYDVFYVLVSYDGASYYALRGYSVSWRNWQNLTFDITRYANYTGIIYLGFLLISDAAVQYEGVYLDDIVVTKVMRYNVYTETVTVNSLVPGTEAQITFPPFTAIENTNYVIAVETLLDGDMNSSNNYKEVKIATYNKPPVTTCNCIGPMGANGWYTGTVRIHLSATDPDEVAYIKYRINGGGWQNYTGLIWVSTEGLYTVEYYSVDIYGSTEDIKSCSFGIATSMPYTECIIDGLLGENGWYVSNVTISFIAHAYICGVGATYYRIDGGAWRSYIAPFVYDVEGQHTIEYYSVSNSGIVETPIKMTTFKIDKTNPSVEVIYPNGGEVVSGEITVR
ncbi:MAG: choice-of-anchor J domain-containing protein, partial [Candidatus Thermoplasmatota archaeon]